MLGVGACTKYDPLYCAEGRPCRAANQDPTLTFCDVDGVYPASDGHGHTCIPNPFDAGVESDGTVHDGALAPDAASRATISVSLSGGGAGVVTSIPAGLDCGPTCSTQFDVGTTLTLEAEPMLGSDFMGWSGPCAGLAACSFTVIGDSLIGASFALVGEILWTEQFGGTSFDSPISMAIRDGALYAVGKFEQSMTVQGSTVTSAGNGDAYVAKLDAGTGNLVWLKRFGAADLDTALRVAVITTGNVVVTGTFSGTIDIGGTALTATGASSSWIAALDGSDGSTVWARKVDVGIGPLAPDSMGDVLVAGAFAGTVTIDGTTLTSNAGSQDAAVIKLSGVDGSLVWAKAFGSSSTDGAAAIVADGSGNAVVTGSFQGSMNLGGTAHIAVGSKDGYFARLAAGTGTFMGSKSFGGGNDDTPLAVAVDAAGAVVVAGFFSGMIDFGPDSISSADAFPDAFVVKFTGAGGYQWSRSFGAPSGGMIGAGFDTAAGLGFVGPDVVVTGDFQNSVDFGGGALTTASANTNDAFLVRYAGADGAHVWSQRFGGAGNDKGSAVLFDAATGRVFAGGVFESFAEFGGSSLTSHGLSDGYVISIAP